MKIPKISPAEICTLAPLKQSCSSFCLQSCRGQKTEGEKGVKAAEPGHQTQAQDSTGTRARLPVLLGTSSWGREQSPVLHLEHLQLPVLQLHFFFFLPCRFFFSSRGWNMLCKAQV